MSAPAGALAGAAALAAAPFATRAARAADETTFEFDVALDGPALRIVRAAPTAVPLAGDTFLMLGTIYPAGTIDAGLLARTSPALSAAGFAAAPSTLISLRATSPTPYRPSSMPSATTSPPRLAPSKAHATSSSMKGIEGGIENAYRSITGGSGIYANARGAVVQTFRGENKTIMEPCSDLGVPAPLYTFTFTLAP